MDEQGQSEQAEDPPEGGVEDGQEAIEAGHELFVGIGRLLPFSAPAIGADLRKHAHARIVFVRHLGATNGERGRESPALAESAHLLGFVLAPVQAVLAFLIEDVWLGFTHDAAAVLADCSDISFSVTIML